MTAVNLTPFGYGVANATAYKRRNQNIPVNAARVRRAVIVDKMSEREVARQFGLARETVRKMLRYSVPPG